MVGKPASDKRQVPEQVFDGAPRLHDGGYLKDDEVPTILQKGEEVLTARDPRHQNNLGQQVFAPEFNITLINNGTPQEIQKQSGGFDGQRYVIQIMLDDLRRNGPIAQGIKRMH